MFFLIVLYDKFSEKWQTNPMAQATHQHQGEATLCSFVFTAGMEFKGIIFLVHLLFILKHYQTALNQLLNTMIANYIKICHLFLT